MVKTQQASAPVRHRLVLRSAAAGLLMASFGAMAAHSADGPARRSGLWALSITGLGGMMSSMQTGVDTAKDRGDSIVASRAKTCGSSSDFSRIPGGYSFHTVCHSDRGMTIDSRGTITGDFQSAYTVKSTTTMVPPIANMPSMSMVMTARYLGACPADMKPGDVKVGSRLVHRP